MLKSTDKNRKMGLLLEVLMIVVGINVGLWFENWFQDLEDAETEQRYLVDLADDLRVDTQALERIIKATQAKLTRTRRSIDNLSQLIELSVEEQARTVFTPSTYDFFEPSDFTFRSMQESGDFRLLGDPAVKKALLRLDRRHRQIALLQANFLQALDDEYIPLMMANFDIAAMQVANPTLFENQMFRNFFVYTAQDTEAMLDQYRQALTETDELIALISAQIDN